MEKEQLAGIAPQAGATESGGVASGASATASATPPPSKNCVLSLSQISGHPPEARVQVDCTVPSPSGANPPGARSADDAAHGPESVQTVTVPLTIVPGPLISQNEFYLGLAAAFFAGVVLTLIVRKLFK